MPLDAPGSPNKDPEGPLRSFVALLRRRQDLAVFLVGAMLFAGGLVNVVGKQVGAPDGAGLSTERAPSPEPKPGRVGPNSGEPVEPYIARKKTQAAGRASKEPTEPSYGIVVFISYRKASEVEALMKDRGLEVVSIHTRVPVAGFKPKETLVGGKTLRATAAGETAEVLRDLKTLEGIAAGVKEPVFRSIYEREIQLHREAMTYLGDDPATVFAVVVKGTNATIGRTISSAQVRYIDLPDDPTATPGDSTFAPLIPEDRDSATFAVN